MPKPLPMDAIPIEVAEQIARWIENAGFGEQENYLVRRPGVESLLIESYLTPGMEPEEVARALPGGQRRPRFVEWMGKYDPDDMRNLGATEISRDDLLRKIRQNKEAIYYTPMQSPPSRTHPDFQLLDALGRAEWAGARSVPLGLRWAKGTPYERMVEGGVVDPSSRLVDSTQARLMKENIYRLWREKRTKRFAHMLGAGKKDITNLSQHRPYSSARIATPLMALLLAALLGGGAMSGGDDAA